MATTKAGFARIAFYFTAITACFCVYSLIQERLMTVGFGPEEEVFEYSVFIVLVNRLVTCAVAALSLKALGQSLSPSAPLLLFAVPSVANVVGSSAQYEALKYVSFPLQALAKCAKSVPVMAWSWITRTRRYYVSDYLSAATVTLGCVLFVLTGDITAPSLPTAEGSTTTHAPVVSFTAVGLALLAIFMIFDGLTCTSQDKLFSSYDMHSCNQLLYTAAWSAILSFAFLGASGQLPGAISFVLRHPDSLWLMLLQSVVSTTVQLFIVFTIKQYGALNFALMMTLRQFLSIVLSCLVFQHDLSALQWLGMLLVIGGLVARSMDKAAASKKSLGSSDGTMTNGVIVKGKTGVIPATPRRQKTIDIVRQPSTKIDEEHEPLLPPNKTSPRPLIPIIASGPPAAPGSTFVSVLQPLGNVLTSPLRGSLRSTLTPAYPGSGELGKEKPG